MARHATAVAVATTAALLAGCGGATPASHRRPATGSAAPGSRTDSSGQVACSTRSLPWKYAGPVEFNAALDGVSAQLRAVAVHRSYDQWLALPRLTLTANGNQWHTTPKPAPQSFRHHYRALPTNGLARGAGYLCVVRFPVLPEPVAVLSTYTGGAHCCTTWRLYDVTSRHVSELALGNMDARITLAGSHPLIETRDDAFSYAFTDFADSGAPLRLLEPTGSGFRNVTRRFQTRVRVDARQLWGYATRRVSKLGFYAAWAADEEMLGRDAYVWRTLRRLAREGQLSVPPNLREPGWPDGQSYIKQLRRFLTHHGYRR